MLIHGFLTLRGQSNYQLNIRHLRRQISTAISRKHYLTRVRKALDVHTASIVVVRMLDGAKKMLVPAITLQ